MQRSIEHCKEHLSSDEIKYRMSISEVHEYCDNLSRLKNESLTNLINNDSVDVFTKQIYSEKRAMDKMSGTLAKPSDNTKDSE